MAGVVLQGEKHRQYATRASCAAQPAAAAGGEPIGQPSGMPPSKAKQQTPPQDSPCLPAEGQSSWEFASQTGQKRQQQCQQRRPAGRQSAAQQGGVPAGSSSDGSSSSPKRGGRPITPDPPPAKRAAQTPASPSSSAAGLAEAGPGRGNRTRTTAAASCQAAACAEEHRDGHQEQQQEQEEGAGAVASLCQRVESFISCLAASPLLQSALFSLAYRAALHPCPGEQQEGEEDPLASEGAAATGGRAGGAAELQLVVSQLAALYLRAGYEEASDATLLAGLWVLESYDCSYRSPASVCLAAYLKPLALFSPELVERLSAAWPNSFHRLRSAVVEAQLELLKKLGWRVGLDALKDVKPCHDWLFPLAPAGVKRQLAGQLDSTAQHALPSTPEPAAATVPAPVPPARDAAAWAAAMRRICGHIDKQAMLLLRKSAAAVGHNVPVPAAAQGCTHPQAGSQQLSCQSPQQEGEKEHGADDAPGRAAKRRRCQLA